MLTQLCWTRPNFFVMRWSEVSEISKASDVSSKTIKIVHDPCTISFVCNRGELVHQTERYWIYWDAWRPPWIRGNWAVWQAGALFSADFLSMHGLDGRFCWYINHDVAAIYLWHVCRGTVLYQPCKINTRLAHPWRQSTTLNHSTVSLLLFRASERRSRILPPFAVDYTYVSLMLLSTSQSLRSWMTIKLACSLPAHPGLCLSIMGGVSLWW